MAAKLGTIACFLCGGNHIYPGPRLEAHLMNEHGAIFNLDFLVELSKYKQNHSTLPSLSLEAESKKPPDKPATISTESQTDPIEEEKSVEGGGSIPCSLEQLEKDAADLLGREIKIDPEKVDADVPTDIVENIDYLNNLDNLDNIGMGEFDSSVEEITRDSLYRPTHFLENFGNEEDEKASSRITVWKCSCCPRIYRKYSIFKQHMLIAHSYQAEDLTGMSGVEMTEEEFTIQSQLVGGHLLTADTEKMHQDSGKDQERRRKRSDQKEKCGSKKEWEPNSFSSRFKCLFCEEEFRKDFKLKLHLMRDHKNEPTALMEKAKEVLIRSKLDGSIFKCGLCSNKFCSIPNFTRHIKDVHNIPWAEYKREYGTSEIFTRKFQCELCGKEIKHTRNIIGSHMKCVHNISWREYQDRVTRLERGEECVDLPDHQLFHCSICGVSVKHKREHLRKKHKIDEDVYETVIAKKNRGDDISEELPDREVFTCMVCERECMDLSRHLLVSHKLSEEEYCEEFLNGTTPTSRTIKQDVQDSFSGEDLSIKPFNYVGQSGDPGSSIPSSMEEGKGPKRNLSSLRSGSSSLRSGSSSLRSGSSPRKRILQKILPRVTSSSEAVLRAKKIKLDCEPLSTDLRCYFDCEEGFKKDYQLFLHLRLKHRDANVAELRKAYAAAAEEIVLTARSFTMFECALCQRIFKDTGPFHAHIQKVHKSTYMEYKERFGRCERESKPFTCQICEKVVKYDRNTVHTHLKNVHGINWTIYLDRIRKIRRGQMPPPLPPVRGVECQVCRASVKYLRDHLRNAHKLTELEYQELFGYDDETTGDVEECEDRPVGHNIYQNLSSPGHHALEDGEIKIPKMEPVELDLTLVTPSTDELNDQNNTTCSVCHMVYSTREDYIHHCQVLHGMTIPLTTLDQDGDQVGDEEEAEEECGPVYKTSEGYQIEGASWLCKAPIPITPPTAMPMEASLSADPQYSNSRLLSRWNLCTFQCGVCGKISQSKKGIYGHIKLRHGLGTKEYREGNYAEVEIKTVWLTCRLCSTEVKFMKDDISNHLMSAHKLKLEQYEAGHMLASDWPSPAGRESRTSRDDSLGDESTTEGVSSHGEAVGEGGGEEDGEERGQKIKTLLKENTKDTLNSANPNEKGSTKLTTTKWECRLCERLIKNLSNNISIHLREQHNLTRADYEASQKPEASKHHEANQQPEDSQKPEDKICQPQSRKKRGVVRGKKLGKKRMKRMLREKEESGKVMRAKSRLIGPGGKFAKPSMIGPGRKLAQPGVISPVRNFAQLWNRCRFKCPLCSKESNEKRDIRKHALRCHDVPLHELEAKFGVSEIKTEYFFCAICHTEVKYIYKNISMHLQHSHSLTPLEYMENHEPSIKQELGLVDEGMKAVSGHVPESQCQPQTTGTRLAARTDAPARKVVEDPEYPGRCHPCPSCPKVFSSSSNRARHLRNAHGKPFSAKRRTTNVKVDSPLRCPVSDCGTVLQTADQLNKHMGKTHNINQNVQVILTSWDKKAAEDEMSERGVGIKAPGVICISSSCHPQLGADEKRVVELPTAEETYKKKQIKLKVNELTDGNQEIIDIKSVVNCREDTGHRVAANGTVDAKPANDPVDVRSVIDKVDVKLADSKVDVKPGNGTVDVKPNDDTADVKPGDDKVDAKPDDATVEAKAAMVTLHVSFNPGMPSNEISTPQENTSSEQNVAIIENLKK